ncbi:hypothetical protein Vadar_028436 [Vaccinium darrowii]|uniref:Uncharacterized protein n=1 Tax=Vaccinium darrowii TaxID=229202 RepID=A0ACB7XVJ8_9ERIC|nr:hypothetical protein Vadar_028436 [Vaccinium darrowii]
MKKPTTPTTSSTTITTGERKTGGLSSNALDLRTGCAWLSQCAGSHSLFLDEHHRCLHDHWHADTAACTRAEHHHHHRDKLACSWINKKGEYKQQLYRGYMKDGSLVAIQCLKMKRSHNTQSFESQRIDLKTPTLQFGQSSRTLLRVSLG